MDNANTAAPITPGGDYGKYDINNNNSKPSGNDRTGLIIGIVAGVLIFVVPLVLVGCLIFYVTSNLIAYIDEHEDEFSVIIDDDEEKEPAELSSSERNSIMKYFELAKDPTAEVEVSKVDCMNAWSAALKVATDQDSFILPCFSKTVGLSRAGYVTGATGGPGSEESTDDTDETEVEEYEVLYMVDESVTKCYAMAFDVDIKNIISIEVMPYANSEPPCGTATMVPVTDGGSTYDGLLEDEDLSGMKDELQDVLDQVL